MFHLLAPKENRRFLRRLVTSIALAAAVPSALAAETLWKTPSGDWFNAASWTAGAPTSSTDAFINNGGTVFVNTPGAKALILATGEADNTSGTLEVGAGGSVTTTGSFGVAVGYNSTGTVRVINGGTLTTFAGTIAPNLGSTGSVLIDGPGSSWTIGQAEFNLAISGTGSITLTNGGLVKIANGTGSLIMATDRLSVANLYIGNGGAAGTIQAKDVYGVQDAENGLGGVATVIFNHNEANYQFTPAIYDSTAVKHIGPGRTILTAAESNYFNATTITAGQFLVQNGLAGTGTVEVKVNGTFGGKGTINGSTTVAGALVAGIDDISRLTFTSDLTLNSSAVVKLELGGQVRGVSYDAIDLTANLAYGGILQLSLVNGFQPKIGDTFRLFSGFTAFSGAFSSIQFEQQGFGGTFNHANGILTITSVPEPGLCGLLASAFLILGVTRRPKAI